MYLTVSALSIPNRWQAGGETLTLQIVAAESFYALNDSLDSVHVQKGRIGDLTSPATLVTCTIDGDDVVVPQFDLYTTTDSPTNENARYAAANFYDSDGVFVGTLLSDFAVPHNYLDPITWAALENYNRARRARHDDTYWNRTQTAAAIAEAVNAVVTSPATTGARGNILIDTVPSDPTSPTAVGINSARVTKVLSADYSNSLATAISEISTPVTLIIKADTTPTAALTVPDYIYLKFENGAKIIKGGSASIEFEGFGILDAESQIACFSGFAAGDITWTGSDYPAKISSNLWDAANWGLRSSRACAAFDEQDVEILVYPGGTPTARVVVKSYQTLHFTRGTYENAIATDRNIVLNSNSKACGDGKYNTFIKESSVVACAATIVSISVVDSPFSDADENIEISDLCILGQPQGSIPYDASRSALGLGNTKNGVITRVMLYYTHGYGAYIGANGTAGNHAENCFITDSSFVGLGTQQVGFVNCRSGQITGNAFADIQFNDTMTSAAVVDCEPNVNESLLENILITNNTFDGTMAQQSWNAITVQSGDGLIARGILVADNVITGTQDFALDFTDSEVSGDSITLEQHNLRTGQNIYLVNDGGAVPSPLVATDTYYVIRIDKDTIQLAETYADALDGTQIALTATGGGDHRLLPVRRLANGLQIAGVTDATFTNNRITGCSQFGIGIHNSARCTLWRNIIHVAGGGGIAGMVVEGVADSSIDGTYLTGSDFAPSQSLEILEAESEAPVDTNGTVVTKTGTGARFFQWWAGRTVDIDGSDYVIDYVENDLLTLHLTSSAGVQTGVTLTTKFSSNKYRDNFASAVTLSGDGTSEVYSNYTDSFADKQNLDADLTAIAALTPSNDDVLQRKGGVWTNRTIAQLKTDLAYVVANISDFAAGVRAVVLTGLSLATSTAVSASDTVLVAIGKLQAQLTLLNDATAYTETLTGAGAMSLTKKVTKLELAATGAVTLAAPTVLGLVKIIEQTVDNGDVTFALTNVEGQSSGTTATFTAVGQKLILVSGASKWVVIKEIGVTLS